jgi:hypothetical protein
MFDSVLVFENNTAYVKFWFKWTTIINI